MEVRDPLSTFGYFCVCGCGLIDHVHPTRLAYWQEFREGNRIVSSVEAFKKVYSVALLR